MRRIVIAVLLTVAAASLPAQAPRGEARLTILHWNDFHAQNTPWVVRPQASAAPAETVGGAATLFGMVRDIRAGRSDVALFDAGDCFQGTPISAITAGRSQVELLNRISPTAVTLGNHEFDYGTDSLKAAFATTTFPVVVSNLVTNATGRTIALPYELRVVGAVRLGIVGAVPPDLSTLTFERNVAGYRVRDIDSSLDLAIPVLKHEKKADLIVLVSHMGLESDTALAARRSDIDVIVGGHTHSVLASPLRRGRALIVQAGSRGRYLGRLDLAVDLDGDSVLSYAGSLLEVTPGAAAPDSATAALVEGWERLVEERLGERIGTLRSDWDRRDGAPVEINVGNFLCDVTREATGADVAFQNVGGIRKDLAAGPITMRDLWEILPFGNTLVTFTVRGAELRAMLEWQTGVGARDFAQVGGLRYVYDASRSAGSRLVALTVQGRDVVDTARYVVATNNYIGSRLRQFFGLAEPSGGIHDTGIVDRDAVVAFIRNAPTIDTPLDGRIEERSGTSRH